MTGVLAPPVDPGRDHVRGDAGAPAVLAAYMDFECPYSANLADTIAQVMRRAGGRMAYVFRHFPLRERHPHAQAAAEAAEAAAAQGRFWEMHDALFEHRRELDRLDDVARAAGLDLDAFRRDLERGAGRERIEEDIESGLASGVDGTPALFVNGRRHRGFYDTETLLEEVELAAGAGGP